MQMSIRWKDDQGRWCDAPIPRQEAFAHFDANFPQSGWPWFRDKLAAWCLTKARDESYSDKFADIWIARYRAIRGIE